MATISWPTVGTIHVGPVAIRPHGVFIAAGFLFGAWLLRRQTRRAGIDDETLWRILSWALVGGLVGMRVAWLAGNWDTVDGGIDVFAVWHGGMSLLGGLAGGVLVGALMVRRAGLPLLPMLDMAAPGLAAGIAIGRVSDLIIGDHLGKTTTLPWGFRYVGGNHPLAGAPDIGAVVHPVALYDLLLTTVLLFALLRFARRAHPPGSAIAVFTLWYGGSRILTDFLRTDPRRLVGLTGSPDHLDPRGRCRGRVVGPPRAPRRRASGNGRARADPRHPDWGGWRSSTRLVWAATPLVNGRRKREHR